MHRYLAAMALQPAAWTEIRFPLAFVVFGSTDVVPGNESN